MNWKVVEIPELRGYVVEWSEPGNYLLSRRNLIYRSPDLKPPFELIAEFPAPHWRKAASHLRLAQRLIRFSVNLVLPLPNGDIFVSFDREIGVLRNGKLERLRGLKRPCRILRCGAAVSKDGRVYFGEYFGNPGKEAVNVYRYTPGEDAVTVAHTFAPGEIRHVHGIYYDQFDDSLVCLTGDADSECRMVRTSDGFRSLEIIGSGDETWRAVSTLFTPDALWYGTDAEYRANTIYRLDRASNDRVEIGQVSGTVFYSKAFEKGKMFTTTAENAPSQTENAASLWCVNEDGSLSTLAKYPKDGWHTTLFGFGTIFLSDGPADLTRLFFSLYATIGDSRVYEIVAS